MEETIKSISLLKKENQELKQKLRETTESAEATPPDSSKRLTRFPGKKLYSCWNVFINLYGEDGNIYNILIDSAVDDDVDVDLETGGSNCKEGPMIGKIRKLADLYRDLSDEQRFILRQKTEEINSRNSINRALDN